MTIALQRLLDVIIKNSPYQERPVRYQYQLAHAGYAMLPMLLEMMRYSEEYFHSDDEAPDRLRHLGAEKITRPVHIVARL